MASRAHSNKVPMLLAPTPKWCTYEDLDGVICFQEITPNNSNPSEIARQIIEAANLLTLQRHLKTRVLVALKIPIDNEWVSKRTIQLLKQGRADSAILLGAELFYVKGNQGFYFEKTALRDQVA